MKVLLLEFRNVYIGSNAGQQATTGRDNVAIGGTAAGYQNKVGNYNVSIGSYAGQYATGSNQFFCRISSG